MARRIVLATLVVVVFLVDEPAQALPILDDGPPSNPRSEPFFAVPGPKGKTTRVFHRISRTRVEKVWEKAGWRPGGYLSDDGEYLVESGSGIDRDYSWEQVMLSFYHRDTLIRAVPLREVLLDPRKVAWHDCGPTWASSMGFISEHRFAVDTADDRRLIYDVTTGAVAEVRPSSEYEQSYPGRASRSADGKPSAPPPKTSPPTKRTWPVVDAEHPVFSQNRRFYAVPGAGRTVTQVFRTWGRGRSEKIWEKQGWDDGTNVSNDGEYLVIGYPGRNVLDRNYTSETVMLTFYRRSTLIRSVPFRGIIFAVTNLWEWKEGYEWGDYRGFISAHRFAIDTVEDKRVIYDVTTGRIVDTEPYPVPRYRARPMVPSTPTWEARKRPPDTAVSR